MQYTDRIYSSVGSVDRTVFRRDLTSSPGDYCDVYLTHDSMSVRKAHNAGRNHLRNVQSYYERMENIRRHTSRANNSQRSRANRRNSSSIR